MTPWLAAPLLSIIEIGTLKLGLYARSTIAVKYNSHANILQDGVKLT